MKQNRTERTGKGRFLMAAGLLLLAAALFLTCYNLWDAARAGRTASETAALLEEQIAENAEDRQAGDGSDEADAQKGEMPVVEIDGRLYIGLLSVPALDLTLPVQAEWDFDSLRTAPCRYSGSYLDDDLVIAGHNYSSHFSPLKWLEPGSAVIFTDVEGREIRYVLDYTEVLRPQETEEMITGGWDLTLFTCTTGGGSRYTLRCVRE